MTMFATLAMLVPALWALLLLGFAGSLRALWREPVFRHPIAILESDDWGAGPASQAQALARLRGVLGACRNACGESPVMTVGVILETADRDAMQSRHPLVHVAVGLDDPRLVDVRAALAQGAEEGVFSLQLHGLAHYWPPTLLALADGDSAVRAWLAEPGLGWTETLPSALQSRWCDARQLPSRPLPAAAIEEAATLEVVTWRRLFSEVPAVAVPTTFIWNEHVERAWARGGVHALVTPGTRHEGRGADGLPTRASATIRNGERGAGGILLLVRDVYFEPVFGHAPSRLADEVAAHAQLGRPALVEMHRFNFCGPRAVEQSYETLRAGLDLLLARVPTVRFLSTAALAGVLERADPAWLDTSLRRRLGIWARRASVQRPFARLARWAGLSLPLAMLGRLA